MLYLFYKDKTYLRIEYYQDFGIFTTTMRTQLNIIIFLISFSFLNGQQLEKDIENNYLKYRELVNSDVDSAMVHILLAKKKNEQLNNANWNAKIHYAIGYCYKIKQNPTLALSNFNQAIDFADKIDNPSVKSMSYNQIGLLYAKENNFQEALKNYHLSLKISELKDELSENTMAVYSNIADLYILQKDTISARKNYHSAQRIGETDGNKSSLASVYNNLAVSYMTTNLDSTEFYLNKALNIYKEEHNTYGQIATQINLATAYLNFHSIQHYPKARDYLLESLDLSRATKNIDYEYYSYFYLGNYYEQAEEEWVRARNYYEEAHRLMNEKLRNHNPIELYRFLSRINSKLGNYQEAYRYSILQHELQDSLYSIERNKQFVEIQTKYDVERKNIQIELLEKQKEIQRGHNQLLFIGALLLIIPLIMLAIFYSTRLKYQKTIRKQDQLLFEQEKETISAKNLVKGQNLERKRIARELHDGVGGRLSAIKIKMDQLNTTSIKDPELKECINQLQDTAKEIRHISHELKDHKINELDFVTLLHHLIDDYKFYFSGEMHFNIFPEDKFEAIDSHKGHYIYRTIQEILNNCMKYAKAHNLYIDCTYDDFIYRFMIEDDGVGFDLKTTKKGMGLLNLHKRVEEMNGKLHIDSSVGRGTTFIIEIPA